MPEGKDGDGFCGLYHQPDPLHGDHCRRRHLGLAAMLFFRCGTRDGHQLLTPAVEQVVVDLVPQAFAAVTLR